MGGWYQALIECVTGKDIPPSTKGPIQANVVAATANRLTFVAKATQLLEQTGIDPAQPWL